MKANTSLAKVLLASALILATPVSMARSHCLATLSGDKFKVSYDKEHKVFYGSYFPTRTSRCQANEWPVVGSGQIKAGKRLVLSAANPADGDGCVNILEFVGTYPDYGVVYRTGYEAAFESTWQSCGDAEAAIDGVGPTPARPNE